MVMEFIKKGILAMFVFLSGFGIIVLCLVTFIGSVISSSNNHPTDEELLANYANHKSDFEQLAQALITETEIRVIFPKEGKCQFEKQELHDNVSNENCEQYIQLFNHLGLEWAYSGNEPLWLSVSRSGLSVSGSTKGYFYSSIPPKNIVNHTDDWDGSPIVYRHIEGHWYIFYERT